MNTASMDTAANITKRLKRANKENIECLSESGATPLKKIKAACAVKAEMVSQGIFVRVCLLLFVETLCIVHRNQPRPAQCFKIRLTKNIRLEMVLESFFKRASKERKR